MSREISKQEQKLIDNLLSLQGDFDDLEDNLNQKQKEIYENYKKFFDYDENTYKPTGRGMKAKILMSPRASSKALRLEIKEKKEALQELKAQLRNQVVKVDVKQGSQTTQMNLEDLYRYYIAKYQLVAYLQEYFKNNPDKAPANEKRLFNKNKNSLLDYIFDNIKSDDIPKNLNFFDKYPRPSNIKGQIERKTGIMRLTDEEAEELLNRQDFSNIYEGKNPLGKQAGNKKIKLLDHQRKFLNGFFLGNLRSAVVFHTVGTGKTFTAVASVKLYLQLYPKGNVIIVTPPAVLFNFIDSMIAYGINPQDKRFNFLSFDRFSRNKKISTKDSLLIIDEAHNLRTEIEGGGLIEEVEDQEENLGEKIKTQIKFNADSVVKGKRPAQFIIKGAEANKIIMLTATPFVNSPYDIENLMAIGESRPPQAKGYFGKLVSGENFRYDYFKYRISKYERQFIKGDFPEMRERYISIIAPEDDREKLKAVVRKGYNSFYSESRQAGLTFQKIKYCIDIIAKNPDKKFVIYSAYVFSGINKIEAELKKNKIDYGFITGGMNVKQIARFIDGYNNYNNPDYPVDKIRVLLISKAGSEGVNLLETRGIFVIDGVWNEALYEQIVARAVRYKSHAKLPDNEQYVDVYKIFLCFPFEKPFIKKLDDGKGFDFQKFFNAFQAIKKAIRQQNNQLKIGDLSNKDILSGDVKGLTQKMVLETAQKSGNFDEEEFKKLKKGSKERKEYLEKNLSFGKDKAKFEAQKQLSVLGGKIPSTDFYMFVLQKMKENKIITFVKEIIKIPMVEKTVENIPNAKKLLEEIKDDKLSEKEIIENLTTGLIGKEKEAQAILKTSLKKGENNIDKLIQKGLELKAMSQAKAKARLRQEFFTPNELVKDMINLSGIDKFDKFTSFKVLEPSAGWGNIVRGLLLVAEKKQYNINIDMVEFEDSNRQELQKLQDLIPTAVQLMKQRNFLLFQSSRKYNFIFMNPPFFLQKKFNKEYTRDVFDYDFILRAYAMLEVGGVLVAITGMKWKDNKAIQKFYKEVDADLKEMKGVKWKGAEVKKGGEVASLDITMIYIKKLVENSKLDDSLLNQSLKLFVDAEDVIDDKKNEPDLKKISNEPVTKVGNLTIKKKKKKLKELFPDEPSLNKKVTKLKNLLKEPSGERTIGFTREAGQLAQELTKEEFELLTEDEQKDAKSLIESRKKILSIPRRR